MEASCTISLPVSAHFVRQVKAKNMSRLERHNPSRSGENFTAVLCGTQSRDQGAVAKMRRIKSSIDPASSVLGSVMNRSQKRSCLSSLSSWFRQYCCTSQQLTRLPIRHGNKLISDAPLSGVSAGHVLNSDVAVPKVDENPRAVGRSRVLRTDYSNFVSRHSKSKIHPVDSSKREKRSINSAWIKPTKISSKNPSEYEMELSALPLVIHPHASCRRHWDFVNLLFVLYITLIVPYRICFDNTLVVNYQELALGNASGNIDGCDSLLPAGDPFLIIDLLVDLFFILDVVVSARTGYVEEGAVVINPKKVGYTIVFI